MSKKSEEENCTALNAFMDIWNYNLERGEILKAMNYLEEIKELTRLNPALIGKLDYEVLANYWSKINSALKYRLQRVESKLESNLKRFEAIITLQLYESTCPEKCYNTFLAVSEQSFRVSAIANCYNKASYYLKVLPPGKIFQSTSIYLLNKIRLWRDLSSQMMYLREKLRMLTEEVMWYFNIEVKG
ncbi:hypothetical protein [Infirmifilum sp.]|jgi:hypothetical protein|uniref:hypothetical protein n=1 Tax=Infirmifilum sp. TaxID=2856575 RepID=UPI003D0CC0CB